MFTAAVDCIFLSQRSPVYTFAPITFLPLPFCQCLGVTHGPYSLNFQIKIVFTHTRARTRKRTHARTHAHTQFCSVSIIVIDLFYINYSFQFQLTCSEFLFCMCCESVTGDKYKLKYFGLCTCTIFKFTISFTSFADRGHFGHDEFNHL
jgi:hypothetical protein